MPTHHPTASVHLHGDAQLLPTRHLSVTACRAVTQVRRVYTCTDLSHRWDRLLKGARSIAPSTKQKALGVAGGCSMGCKGSKAATAEPKLEIEVVDDTVSCVSFCNSPGSDDDRITIGIETGDL